MKRILATLLVMVCGCGDPELTAASFLEQARVARCEIWVACDQFTDLETGALPDGVSKRDLGAVHLKDIDEPEQVTQLVIDGLPASFPPLRAEQEEPMDFGERLSRKIQADVERKIEAGFAGERAVPTKALTGLAVFGLVILVLFVAAIVAIVLLVKLVV